MLDAPHGWKNTGQLKSAQNIWALTNVCDSIIYAGGDSVASKGFVFKTTNFGSSWVNTGIPACIWVHSLVLVSDTLYAGTSAGVFKYNTTWISTNLTKSVNTLLKAKNGILYAGTSDGNIYKSNDGNIWTSITVNNGVTIWKIIQDSVGNLYACGRRAGKKDTIAGVFKSVDGLTFDTTTFPHIDRVVYSLTMSDSAIYAGTGPDSGKVFRSFDKGTSWSATQSLSYANCVYSLLKADNGTIYAGTGTLSGYLYESSNGTSWSFEQIDAQISAIYSLMQTNNGFLYVGSNSGSAGNGRVSKAGYFPTGSLTSSIFTADSFNSVNYGKVNWNVLFKWW